jgi:hypothetical protein
VASNATEYAIQIASTMVGGEHTISQLDEMTAQLMGAGKGAAHFQQAIQRVSKDLDGMKAASVAANDALAAGADEYKALELAANQAAKAAERASVKHKGAIPPELAARAAAAKAALDAYRPRLAGLEADAAAASAGHAHLTKTLANLRKLSGHVDKSLGGQAQALGDLREAAGAAGGPLGSLVSGALAPVQAFKKLSAGMGESRAAALVLGLGAAAAAVGVAVLTAAVVAGVVALASYAVGLADADRSASLTRDAVAALHPEFAAVRGELASIEAATGVSGARLDDLAKSLIDAKVSAEDMPDALRAAATAEAALGQGGAASFIADLKAGKVAAGDFADEIDAKFGGIVAKKMRGLDAQGAKLKKNFAGVFSGLDIEPVLSGMSILVDMFSKSSVAGEAMRFLFESVFQPLINQAEKAAYVVEAFALGFLIGLTKLYIGLKPAIKAIGDFFGFESTGLADTLDIAKTAGEFLVPVFIGLAAVIGTLMVGAVVLLTGVLAPLIATAATAAAPFIAAGLAIAALGAAFYQA